MKPEYFIPNSLGVFFILFFSSMKIIFKKDFLTHHLQAV